VIDAMTAAGAVMEDAEGEDLCVLRIDGMHSEGGGCTKAGLVRLER
jgi:hypothetical protein